MSSPYFFGAAVGGFLLMTAVGVPALVALCSSLSLIHISEPTRP